MSPIDQRKFLEGNPFDYQVFKSNKIQIYYNNKAVMLVKEDKAMKLLRKLESASDHEIQLALAKITGNFKFGNEKTLKKEKYEK